jgi:hypothetical protein
MTVITRVSYTGNGTATDFTIPFQYIDRSHVYVSVNNTLTTAFTFFSSTTIRFNTAPVSGANIVIYRRTPIEAILADFTPASALREQDLELDLNQLLFIIQELTTDLGRIDGAAMDAAQAAIAAALAAALTAINNAINNGGSNNNNGGGSNNNNNNGITNLRVNTSHTTGVLAQDGVADFTMNLGKLSELVAVQVSEPSWVRIYRSSAQRGLDTRTSPGGTLQAVINLADTKPYSENVTATASQTIIQNPVPLLQGDSAGLVYVRLIKKSAGSSTVTFTTTTLRQET